MGGSSLTETMSYRAGAELCMPYGEGRGKSELGKSEGMSPVLTRYNRQKLHSPCAPSGPDTIPVAGEAI